MPIRPADYILPLCTGEKINENTVKDLNRYAGVGYYIGKNGIIATCAHIVEAIKPQEILMAKDFHLNKFFEVKNLKVHPEVDFAIGQIDVRGNRVPPMVDEQSHPLMMGTDVVSFGYVNYGKDEKNLNLQYRFFKGYITFLGNKPHKSLRSRTFCEVSFPSLAGFSGSPIFFNGTDILAGMLFGNNESDIEVFSYSEIKEPNHEYTEKVFRTLEFGTAHTVSDIKLFLNDLKVPLNT